MATATLNPTAERWQVSRDEYHADRDCLSNSATSVFIENPALYHGRFITGEYPHESTKATEFGDVFHEIVLEPQRVVDWSNYGNGTVARFARCERPNRSPDFSSESGSRYWNTEHGLIRESDHWGPVRQCWWSHESNEPGDGISSCGFCEWHDFFYSDRFRIIPPDALNGDGHRKGAEWKAFAAMNTGKYLFKESEFFPIAEMLASIRRHPRANALLFGGNAENELKLRWHCERHGIMRRCMIDRLNPHVIADLKTTGDSSAEGFAKSVWKFGYHRQQAFYQDAVHQLTGEFLPFVFIAVEKDPPYSVGVYDLSDEFAEAGYNEVESAINRLVKCRESGIWERDGYGEIVTLRAPRWSKYADDYSYEE